MLKLQDTLSAAHRAVAQEDQTDRPGLGGQCHISGASNALLKVPLDTAVGEELCAYIRGVRRLSYLAEMSHLEIPKLFITRRATTSSLGMSGITDIWPPRYNQPVASLISKDVDYRFLTI